MKFDIHNRDFWAALMLIAIGVGAALVARGYPMGTALRMGAGYFPTMLGGLLAVFGVGLLVKSLVHGGKPIDPGWSPRALIVVPLAFALFGFMLDRVGFVPAMLTLVFGAALAGRDFKLVEVATLAAGLTGLCVVVFVWGLGLPYPLFAVPNLTGLTGP